MKASMSEERWRMFCAIELPEELRTSAAAHIATLCKAAPPDARVSWQRAENLHLTVKFLGEIAQNRIAYLSEASSRAAKQSQPFNLTIEGFAREERSFSPHLTIARIRAPQGARSIAASHQAAGFEAIEIPVRELTVMRSELGPGGSRYTAISRHEIGEAASR